MKYVWCCFDNKRFCVMLCYVQAKGRNTLVLSINLPRSTSPIVNSHSNAKTIISAQSCTNITHCLVFLPTPPCDPFLVALLSHLIGCFCIVLFCYTETNDPQPSEKLGRIIKGGSSILTISMATLLTCLFAIMLSRL